MQVIWEGTKILCKLSYVFFPSHIWENVVGWAHLREFGCWRPILSASRGLWMGSRPPGGSSDPPETSQEGEQGGEGNSRGEGDTVPAVTHSSESTRSYRRIGGVVGKLGSAGSPQSPGGPEDPALSKVPPVPMPRRFAPVGANPSLCMPKHPSSSYPGVADGVIRGLYPWCHLLDGLRGACHPPLHSVSGQGEAEAGKGSG